MRILLVHNRYQLAGGEDVVFEAEARLLRRHGHDVHEHVEDNDTIDPSRRLRLALDTIWSSSRRTALQSIARANAIELVHFHNTFPLISPAAYGGCREAGAAIVQTLHNYRLLCPSATLFRDGRPCEDCVGRVLPWPGVAHACYRGSRMQTAAAAAMLTAHRLRGTWAHDVDLYLALTRFARERFIAGGLPADRIRVKPNFLPDDPGGARADGGDFLFVGRLDQSKGVETLVRAWASMPSPPPLRIAGDGPLAEIVRAAAAASPSVTYLGALPRAEVQAEMRAARALIFPSLWYEGMPMTILEAFACGLPVIASRRGSLEELVDDGRTGLTVAPGDPAALAAAVAWASQNPERLAEMGRAARREFEDHYRAEANYPLLMDAYETALRRRNDSPVSPRTAT
jgi:glycosyltransferase involved in cell wall biosynthesis